MHPAVPPLALKTLLLNSSWVRKCPPLITWLKYEPASPRTRPKMPLHSSPFSKKFLSYQPVSVSGSVIASLT